MSITRLSAIVAILVIGTAVAVGAYLDTQRGTLPDPEVGSPILEFGPSYPMPRPLRAADRTPVRRPSRPTTPADLVRAPRVEAEGGPATLASPPTPSQPTDPRETARPIPASAYRPAAL